MTADHHQPQEEPQESVYKPGDVVLTTYGVGVIVSHNFNNKRQVEDGDDHDNNNEFFTVRLGRRPGESISSASLGYFQKSAFQGKLPAAPGMTTTSLVPLSPPEDEHQQQQKEEEEEHHLKLNPKVLVHCYYADCQKYLVSILPEEDQDNKKPSNNEDEENDDDNNNLPLAARRLSSAVINNINNITASATDTPKNHLYRDDIQYRIVNACDLDVAPAAKFYPVLETLMMRGEQTAVAAANLLQDEKTKRFVDTTGKALQQQVDSISTVATTAKANAAMIQEHHDVLPAIIEKQLDDWTTTVTSPEGEASMKQVLQLVKDEELTTLLENCKERLQQLVQTDLSTATQKALEKTGIKIEITTMSASGESSSMPSSFAESMIVSRKAALSAVEQLLEQSQIDPSQLNQMRNDVVSNFNTAFDSLTMAAKSDRSLNAVFESVVEKTAEWQKLSGRILQTKSANLFMEGATRLKVRAATILQQTQNQQMNWAGDIGNLLTKSFTEGDAALARLKTVEFGDAIKNRLVEAIEVRSESLGGLDGIIAGALTNIKSKSGSLTGSGADQMQDLLTGLQKRASTVTTDTHETLISLLSSRSTYRDVALLRIESVLCMLESNLDDISGLSFLEPEDIAAIASGEGGTAKIFQPIAKRAMEQIENQLDVAETNVSDLTTLEVLKRVRKIMSGELTIDSVMDEVVSILNDDNVVKAGETFIQHSERVLDVIEGASGGGNQAVNEAIKMVEKAGITKSTVMAEIEKLDVNDLLDTAGSAVTDESARRKLLSKATDTALDFVLKILPSMPVPPFEGVNDGLLYHISNLSMKGFKVRKEDIQIELAGMRATRRASTAVVEIQHASSSMDESMNGGGSTHSYDSADSTGTLLEVEEIHNTVKATELLIIDIRNISAVLDNAAWSFEQTYMPYWKGQGLADVALSGGAIRLQFELRKRRKELQQQQGSEKEDKGSPAVVWEPVLCLHDRTCIIADVDLKLQGEGRLTWILNKLASIFKGPLRDYVVRTIVSVLTNRSGWLLERLNDLLQPYWDLILRTAGLAFDDLVEADEKVVVKEELSEYQRYVELVWRERLPLGMNLLMNDDSGYLKIVDFPRGSQARLVCEKRGYDPDIFKGSRLVAVNGTEYDDQEELFGALRDPARPKTVQFELVDPEDAEKVRRFVEGKSFDSAEKDEPSAEEPERVFELRDVTFGPDQPDLGIEFGNSVDNFGLVVRDFMEGGGGTVGAAESSGKVQLGDLLVKINGKLVVSTDGNGRSQAVELLESNAAVRPLCLTFADPYLYSEIIEKPEGTTSTSSDGGPSELLLDEKVFEEGSKRIVLTGFEDISGKAESSGILIGDHLVFVNGLPVGAGCRWLFESPSPTLGEVQTMLEDEMSYPAGLTFARARQIEGERRWSPAKLRAIKDDEADTMCVTVDACGQLGCIFEQKQNYDIQVKDFESVPGTFQLALAKLYKDDNGDSKKVSLSVDSLNGQFVPSYATKDMVRNAVARSWKSDGRVEMWLCDDQRKRWIHHIAMGS